MSIFWKFFAGIVDKAFAKEQAAIDEVAPTAVGRPVDEVEADLAAALARRKCNLGDEATLFYAEKLVRGEKVVVGKVVEQPGQDAQDEDASEEPEKPEKAVEQV